MSHNEFINTPFALIYDIIEKVEEQKVIELDMFKFALMHTISGLFTKNTKTLYDIFLKGKNGKSKEEKKADEEFNSMLETLGFK